MSTSERIVTNLTIPVNTGIIREIDKIFAKILLEPSGSQSYIIGYIAGFISGSTTPQTTIQPVTRIPEKSSPLLHSEPETAPQEDKEIIKRVRANDESNSVSSSVKAVPKKKKNILPPEPPEVHELLKLENPKARKEEKSDSSDKKDNENNDPRKTPYGYKSRREFRIAYEKVQWKVQNYLAQKLIDLDVVYPSVCTNKQCPLCISWFIGTAITPCHPKHCDGKCRYGYYPHTSQYGLKLLKKYHSRIHKFPIHINDRQPDGPEFEDALCRSYVYLRRFDEIPKYTQYILKIASNTTDMARLMKHTLGENSDGLSETDSESDGSHRPLIITKPKTSRKVKGKTSFVDVLTSTEFAGI